MSRIPGTKNAAQVTTAPTTPAATSVPRVPIAPATGPVRAKDSGSRPIEMSQSRLETRPSMARGTWRCFVVAQTIVPAVSRALNATAASMSCQSALERP
jgi:hypothetical protein